MVLSNFKWYNLVTKTSIFFSKTKAKALSNKWGVKKQQLKLFLISSCHASKWDEWCSQNALIHHSFQKETEFPINLGQLKSV